MMVTTAENDGELSQPLHVRCAASLALSANWRALMPQDSRSIGSGEQ